MAEVVVVVDELVALVVEVEVVVDAFLFEDEKLPVSARMPTTIAAMNTATVRRRTFLFLRRCRSSSASLAALAAF